MKSVFLLKIRKLNRFSLSTIIISILFAIITTIFVDNTSTQNE